MWYTFWDGNVLKYIRRKIFTKKVNIYLSVQMQTKTWNAIDNY